MAVLGLRCYMRPFSSWSVRAAHCGGFSCGAQALGAWALVAVVHGFTLTECPGGPMIRTPRFHCWGTPELVPRAGFLPLTRLGVSYIHSLSQYRPSSQALVRASPASFHEVAQWCPTLSHPMDCSIPGSSVLGIFQEWGAIAFSHIYAQACLNN